MRTYGEQHLKKDQWYGAEMDLRLKKGVRVNVVDPNHQLSIVLGVSLSGVLWSFAIDIYALENCE